MIFMTYRPKTAKNVKAEKITAENINDIAASFFGSARVIKHAEQGPTLKIATLEGIITGELTNWVVRHEDAVEVMSDEDFEKKYERARNLRES